MDRRHFIGTIAAVLVAGRASSQVAPTVKGSRDDLRGAKRVFVDTSYDHSLNEALTAELKAQLPELEIAADEDGAELILRCSRGVTDPNDHNLFEDPPFSASTTAPRSAPAPLTRRMPRDSQPTSPAADDGTDDSDEPRRFLVGSVLRRVAAGPDREIIQFRQPIRMKAENTARDFVRKLAKEYHKANPGSG